MERRPIFKIRICRLPKIAKTLLAIFALSARP
jgi:hypothetical protein